MIGFWRSHSLIWDWTNYILLIKLDLFYKKKVFNQIGFIFDYFEVN